MQPYFLSPDPLVNSTSKHIAELTVCGVSQSGEPSFLGETGAISGTELLRLAAGDESQSARLWTEFELARPGSFGEEGKMISFSSLIRPGEIASSSLGGILRTKTDARSRCPLMQVQTCLKYTGPCRGYFRTYKQGGRYKVEAFQHGTYLLSNDHCTLERPAFHGK